MGDVEELSDSEDEANISSSVEEISDSDDDDESSDSDADEILWNSEQLEMLTSAKSAFRFLPRPTTEKLWTELSKSSCTTTSGTPVPSRGQVRAWFSNQEPRVASAAMSRYEERARIVEKMKSRLVDDQEVE